MDSVQVNRGRQILWAVSDFASEQGWDKSTARRAARMAIMCAMDESSLRVLANPNVPESMSLPHDGTGHDHASVGLFQQQVPGWGTAAQCMDPIHSTRHFLRALASKFADRRFLGVPQWVQVQAVQVSAIADGSNYERYRRPSFLFVVRYWNLATGRPYGRRTANYPQRG